MKGFGVLLALILSWSAGAAKAQVSTFIAATWSDDAVHLLDADLNSISSFPAGASDPNGIATDGTLIYTGHFTTNEVIAYDFSGAEQFRWSASIGNLQGMEVVGGELAIASGDAIQFHDPSTGNLIRSVPSTGGSEGLSFDGTVLWSLAGDIVALDPQNGNVVRTIANAASGCSFNGTGISVSAPGELHLGCNNGDWYRVSSGDGSVLESGNNGLDMYGLKLAAGAASVIMSTAQPVPTLGPAALCLLIVLLGVLGRSRLRGDSR